MNRREFIRDSLLVLGYPAVRSLSVIAPRGGRSTRGPRPTVLVDLPQNGTDVTAQLMDVVENAPDETTFAFAPGRYHLEGSLWVQGRKGLTFEGGTFYALNTGPLNQRGFSERRHFWFQSCERIAVRGLRVESSNRGPNPADPTGYGFYDPRYAFEHGLQFQECAGVVVEGCSTFGTWGDGLNVSKDTRQVTVTDLTVSFNGRQGIALTHAENVLLDGVHVTNSRRAGVDLEPLVTSNLVRDVEIRNSTINSYLLAVSAGGKGDVSDVFVHHNRISSTGSPWVYCRSSQGTRRANWRVEDNVVDSTLGGRLSGMRFGYVDDVHLNRNVVPMATRKQYATSFDSCYGAIEITGNDFRQAANLYALSGGSTTPTESGNLLGPLAP